MELTGSIRPWRPKIGQVFYGEEEKEYFAWLPSIPEGKVIADISGAAGDRHLEGVGYHDHNWGNCAMQKAVHHWYWGRAKIGDYSVIAVWITSEKRYSEKEFDIFMLAKNGEIIGDNQNHTLKFVPEDPYTDEVTGKSIYNKVIYEYETPAGEYYRIIFKREGDIKRDRLINSFKGITKLGAKLIGFDGAYHRFFGEATMERMENGKVVETTTEPHAVWEMQYFGKNIPLA